MLAVTHATPNEVPRSAKLKFLKALVVVINFITESRQLFFFAIQDGWHPQSGPDALKKELRLDTLQKPKAKQGGLSHQIVNQELSSQLNHRWTQGDKCPKYKQEKEGTQKSAPQIPSASRTAKIFEHTRTHMQKKTRQPKHQLSYLQDNQQSKHTTT